MVGMSDAVYSWVAHVDVGAGHVDFGAHNSGTIWQVACAHLGESG
jgi:hypothetical protein